MGGLSRLAEAADVLGRLSGQAPVPRLTYNPGPGIYSRLERAVEAMPESVRVQELPGLIKRYKDGVPGWELKAVDLDSTIAGRAVVPREELLAAVKERSPVYTHREVVLGGTPQTQFQPEYYVGETPSLAGETVPVYQRNASPLGQGRSHGEPRYQEYGQGGDDYSELLIMQPTPVPGEYGNHWAHVGQPSTDVRVHSGDSTVAHARFDTHGDALRINELQSDLGIHNRKIREKISEPGGVTARYPDGTVYALDEFGIERPVDPQVPFPLEDAWADLLIKRIALEAARKGHRAIEVASPRAIADKVGGNIDNYEHFYGKVVPGALERLGRKMGGLTAEQARLAPEPTPIPHYGESARRLGFRATDAMNDAITLANGWVGRQRGQRSVGDPFEEMVDAMSLSNDYREQAAILSHAQEVHDRMVRTAIDNGYPDGAAKTLVARAMPGVMRDAENVAALRQARARLAAIAREHAPPAAPAAEAGRRYIMSDEMRKRILTQGIPAAVAIGIGTDQVLDRLDKQAPPAQVR